MQYDRLLRHTSLHHFPGAFAEEPLENSPWPCIHVKFMDVTEVMPFKELNEVNFWVFALFVSSSEALYHKSSYFRYSSANIPWSMFRMHEATGKSTRIIPLSLVLVRGTSFWHSSISTSFQDWHWFSILLILADLSQFCWFWNSIRIVSQTITCSLEIWYSLRVIGKFFSILKDDCS